MTESYKEKLFGDWADLKIKLGQPASPRPISVSQTKREIHLMRERLERVAKAN